MGKSRTIVRTPRIDRIAREVARLIVERWQGKDEPAGRIYHALVDRTSGGLVVMLFTKGRDQAVKEAARGGVTILDL